MCNSAERAEERGQDDLPAICQAEERKVRPFHGKKEQNIFRQAHHFERGKRDEREAVVVEAQVWRYTPKLRERGAESQIKIILIIFLARLKQVQKNYSS